MSIQPSLVFRSLVALGAMVFALSCSSSQDDVIAERIKAVGTVCVEGDPCAAEVAAAANSGPMSAEDVYKQYCAACHDSGAAGAPKYQNAGDWGMRLAAGIDTVYANAINGKGGMPARGLCMNCSDDEIRQTVDLMVEGL